MAQRRSWVAGSRLSRVVGTSDKAFRGGGGLSAGREEPGPEAPPTLHEMLCEVCSTGPSTLL